MDTLKLLDNMTMNKPCPLCLQVGGELVAQNEWLRIIFPDEPELPGFCRIIWQKHIAEMSDLSQEERNMLWTVLHQVEEVIREVMQPEKINLASLGNMVPHLHWHVVPRYQADIYFPGSPWSAPQRASDSKHLQLLQERLPQLKERLQTILAS